MIQTRKKQYNKGRRRDICGLILQCGALTNKGLRLYWNGKNEYVNKSQAVAVLRREQIIYETSYTTLNEEDRVEKIRLYTLNNQSDDFDVCIPTFPVGTLPVFNQFLDPLEKYVRADDIQKKTRVAKMVDAHVLMLCAGVKCTAIDMFNLFNPASKQKGSPYCVEGDKNYFIPYQYKREDWQQIIILSRSIGTYLHRDNEVYSVYNFGNTRPVWKRALESANWTKRINLMVESLCPTWNVGKVIEDRSRRAIVIATDKPIINLLTEKVGTGPAKKYLVLPSMYRAGMYHIPFSDDGVKMMRLINRPKWREYIYRSVLGDAYGTAKRGNGVSHDANDGKKMTLVFCVPDIERLRNFIINARAYDEKENFEIICFPHQLSLIQKVAGEVCTIHVFPMDKLEGVGEKIKF